MPSMFGVLTCRQFQGLAISHFNTMIGLNFLTPILPVYLHGIGFLESQIGGIMGATAVSGLILRPLAGIQSDKRGSRPVMLFGQVLVLISTLGLLFGSDTLSYAFFRLLFGMGWAFYGTSAVTFASSIGKGETNNNAIAFYTLITMVGLGLSMSLSQMSFEHFGFRSTVLISCAFVTMAMIVAFFRTTTVVVNDGKQAPAPFFSVLREKSLIAVSVGQFGSGFAFGALFTYIPLASIKSGVTFYSLFFIAFAVAVISSRFFVQKAIDRYSLEKTGIYSTMAMALGAALLLASVNPAVLVLTGVLFGLGYGMAFPVFVMILVRRINPTNRGTSLGVLIASGDTGSALSTTVLGTLAECRGYFPLFLVVTGILLTSLYLVSVMLAPKRVR